MSNNNIQIKKIKHFLMVTYDYIIEILAMNLKLEKL